MEEPQVERSRTRGSEDARAQEMRHELELAQQVQANLLPQSMPVLDGYQIAAKTQPARYVSGDLYDLSPCDPDRCHLFLADTSGHGVAAALLASSLRTLVRVEAANHCSPAGLLARVQQELQADLEQTDAFITAFAGWLETRLGRLVYANAGHPEALWLRVDEETCQRLPATGLPLGIRAPSGDVSLRQETIYLRPGDLLVFYSDGVTEAASPQGELYGLERLASLVQASTALPAQALAQAIVQEVEAFQGGGARADDLTLLVLKVLPRRLDFEFPASLDHLRDIASLVRHSALAYGEELAYQVELAACEIVTNVFQHACGFEGQVRGRIALDPHEIRIDLYDDGASCDLDAIPAPPLGELQQGGYGLHIARQLLDELSYESADDGGSSNHWRMVKVVPKESRADDDR